MAENAVNIAWNETWVIHNVDLPESLHLENYRNDGVLVTASRFQKD